MRIAVMSPKPSSGTTTITYLIAQALSLTQNLEVMITYSGHDRYLSKYLDYNSEVDRTCSLSQIVKLLNVNAIEPKNFYEYSTHLGSNLYLMDTADKSVDHSQTAKLLEEVYSKSPSDITLCDLSFSEDNTVTEHIMSCSDLVIVVVKNQLSYYDAIQGLKVIDKPTIFVVNEYNPQVCSLREVSSNLRCKYSDTYGFHYNPYIQKFSNKSELSSISKYAYKDPDFRFLEIRSDMVKILKRILKGSSYKFSKEVI